ncbi:hypothetical protein [Clostridium frigidicarnis]|uniref:Uncharacterized protein n=1 Tax=Clostridium frigidicarnis TaxID=84698 RepID=A0A1I1B2W5_9CLOT|nr:hypothetical protein [Clostridium frigidicarnis]SFB43986.1 hypothetical protein SAMN04488528_10572 [Clostridium frigidicarnis]
MLNHKINEKGLELPFFAGRRINKTPLLFSLLIGVVFGFIGYLVTESITYTILTAIVLFSLVIFIYYPLYLNSFFNYWTMDEDKIMYVSSNSYQQSVKRLLEGLCGNEKNSEKVIFYQDIKEISIVYKRKVMDVSKTFTLTSYAPTAYMPYLRDPFYINVLTKDNAIIELDISLDYFKNQKRTYLSLPEICDYFIGKGILVKDYQNIEQASKEEAKIDKYIY